MTTLPFGSKAMPLARDLPPVTILALAAPDFRVDHRDRAVAIAHPDLRATVDTTMPFGPRCCRFFAMPTKPAMRETNVSDLVSKTTTPLLSLSAR